MIDLAKAGGSRMIDDHVYKLRYEPDHWNEWRAKNLRMRPDLSGAVINLGAPKSTLNRADSVFRIFHMKGLRGIDLHDADLTSSQLRFVNFCQADFSGADCRRAEFRHAALAGADFRHADLREAQFLRSDLIGSNLSGAIIGATHFGFTSLRSAIGLSDLRHLGPSQIDQFSILASDPPYAFLHACGVNENLLRFSQIIAAERSYYSSFISYSRSDEAFVETLRFSLTHFGAPSWFAPQDLRHQALEDGGIELQRDLYDFVDAAECFILVISQNILKSGWVGLEFQRARGRKNIIPLLIRDMPAPDSPQWNNLLTPCADVRKFSQLNVEAYSRELGALLATGYLDCRNLFDVQDWQRNVAKLLETIRRPR